MDALLQRAGLAVYAPRLMRTFSLAGVLVGALIVGIPTAASAESIVDVIAPGMKDFPKDFKFPNKKCEEDCKQYLTQLNFIREDIEKWKFDTDAWKDWWKADQEAQAKEAALKPFTDAVGAAQKDLADAKKKGGRGCRQRSNHQGKERCEGAH